MKINTRRFNIRSSQKLNKFGLYSRISITVVLALVIQLITPLLSSLVPIAEAYSVSRTIVAGYPSLDPSYPANIGSYLQQSFPITLNDPSLMNPDNGGLV